MVVPAVVRDLPRGRSLLEATGRSHAAAHLATELNGTAMDDRKPLRITSVMGVARALLSTLDRDETADILVAEFGWDAAFQALSLLQGAEAGAVLGLVWQKLVTDPIREELCDPARPAPSRSTD